MYIYINGNKIHLDPSQSLGKGGEADVYDIGNGQVVKVFKTPDHPDYQGLPHEQQGARDRLAEHQQKLRQFPQNLPSRTIKPDALVTDRSGKTVLGYRMQRVNNAQLLLKYSDRKFRQSGISPQTVVRIFQDLHQTVAGIHACGVVIGDFNDLNVLVCNTQAYLIDADSFQYGGFLCRVFTARFVDPLLCEPQGTTLVWQHPHSKDSDWYAFILMLMQCLLFVDPYGGVYRPKASTQRLPHEARRLHRITVFHPEVVYPKPAIPYKVLPDELLHYFHCCFENDRRGEFPRSLLDNLQWTTCTNCHLEHARDRCPNCTQLTPTPPLSILVRGTVTATRVFSTQGVILFATQQGHQLSWLYYEGEEFKREDGTVVLTGELDPQLQFRLHGKTTLIGKQGKLIALHPHQSPSYLAVETFDANYDSRYWTYNGQLLRDGQLGAEYIGDVLPNQTQFWVGSHFGFGLYRAGNLNVAFVFDAKRQGICDRVKLPTWSGQLIDATCSFSSDRCWFFWTSQQEGRRINRCAVIHPNGTVEASTEIEFGDRSWLATLEGKCAANHFLFAATDDGIVRVEPYKSQIVTTKEFPDTEPFVNTNSQIVASQQGLYIINPQEILLLKLLN
ncbi:MAG TPA: hypothetical protein DDZ80_17055 [Cyanobacteria bacterium UBA8803]|nr:hypothetical protein [Cyanobacteria bacterium UBA9273]HBL60107.1 hypothetical protein [Cyanobacteria bacterium UBA8803]